MFRLGQALGVDREVHDLVAESLVYLCTFSMICCGLPTRRELRSTASSSDSNTEVIPNSRSRACRASEIGRYFSIASCEVFAA